MQITKFTTLYALILQDIITAKGDKKTLLQAEICLWVQWWAIWYLIVLMRKVLILLARVEFDSGSYNRCSVRHIELAQRNRRISLQLSASFSYLFSIIICPVFVKWSHKESKFVTIKEEWNSNRWALVAWIKGWSSERVEPKGVVPLSRPHQIFIIWQLELKQNM